MLRISYQTGRNRLSQGRPMPPSTKIGQRRLFDPQEVEEWLKAQPRPVTGAAHKT